MSIKKKLSILYSNRFIKDSLILTGGTLVAQIVPIAFYPLLTRLFSPADFGIYATVASITAILSVLASGKYDSVILITDTKRKAAVVIWLILIISFSILLLFELIFYFSSDLITKIFDVPSLKYWILIAPPTAFLIIIYACYNEWCVKNKYFINLSINKITNTSSMTISQSLFGWIKIFSGGLIVGNFLGRIITATVCVSYAIKKDKEAFAIPSFKQIKWSANRYISAPKFILPAQLLNVVGGELPVLLMVTAFSATQIGYFAMAISVLALPASLISLAVRDTFRKQANDIYKASGNCFSLYKKTLSVMAIISILGFSLFYFTAPQLFSIVLGEEWVTAGEYAQILVPIVAISFVSETASSMFIIAEKMKLLLWWQIIYFMTTLISLLIGVFVFKDIKITLLCFMLGRSITHVLSLIMTSKFAMGKE